METISQRCAKEVRKFWRTFKGAPIDDREIAVLERQYFRNHSDQELREEYFRGCQQAEDDGEVEAMIVLGKATARNLGHDIADVDCKVKSLFTDAWKAREQIRVAGAAAKLRVLLKPDQIAEAVQEIRALMESGSALQSACKTLEQKYGVSYKTLKRYFNQAGE